MSGFWVDRDAAWHDTDAAWVPQGEASAVAAPRPCAATFRSGAVQGATGTASHSGAASATLAARDTTAFSRAECAVSRALGTVAAPSAAGTSGATGAVPQSMAALQPLPAGSAGMAMAPVATATVLCLARQGTAGTGVREMLRLFSPLTLRRCLRSPFMTTLRLISPLELEQTS